MEVPKYRPTRQVPYNLNERTRISFEDTLYSQGLEFLSGLIIPGASAPSATRKPVFMPSPTYFRVVTTLLAHPSLTTQLSRHEPSSTAPGNAYILLRRLIKLVGPLNSGLAMSWNIETKVRSGRRSKKEREQEIASDDQLAGSLANHESLFAVVEDLWSIVGWAFTCSVLHHKRWKWWKLFLDVLLEALEADWDDRLETHSVTGQKNVLEEAMVIKFLPDMRGSGGYKRVVRAILANGNGKPAGEWGEVWKDELSTTRPKNQGDYGFIGNGEDDVEASAEGRDTPDSEDFSVGEADEKKEEEEEEGASAADIWGGFDSLILRQRFLSLLSVVSSKDCYISIDDLYHEFKDSILPLPLSSFELFTSTLLETALAYRSSLNQLILETIISSNSPAKRNSETDELTQDAMIKRYLPYPANTASMVDNAKVGLLVEGLLRLLANVGYLNWSQDLEDAVERGICARQKKVRDGKAKRKGGETEEEVKAVCKTTDMRLRAIVTWAKAHAQD